jgi:hypothetical protein
MLILLLPVQSVQKHAYSSLLLPEDLSAVHN